MLSVGIFTSIRVMAPKFGRQLSRGAHSFKTDEPLVTLSHWDHGAFKNCYNAFSTRIMLTKCGLRSQEETPIKINEPWYEYCGAQPHTFP